MSLNNILECQGRSLEFYYDPADFYKSTISSFEDINLPLSHPLSISMILIFVPGPVLPIIGYIVIFW